jgi:hypothetical protein
MRAKTALSKIATERESLIPKGNQFHNRIPLAKNDNAEHTPRSKKWLCEQSEP